MLKKLNNTVLLEAFRDMSFIFSIYDHLKIVSILYLSRNSSLYFFLLCVMCDQSVQLVSFL